MIARIKNILEQKIMSLLLADAGATKTKWLLVRDGESEHQTIVTTGINPTLKENFEIESVLFDELLPQIDRSGVEKVVFYGAGCRAWAQAERMRRLLKEVFTKAELTIKTDIEGAGKAVLGKNTGILIVSGTGSSAGFFLDGALEDMMPSKAYPEGDYGSGSHIGALILNDYFAEEAPDVIKTTIDNNRRLTMDDLFLQFQDPSRSKLIAAKALRDVLTMSESDVESVLSYLNSVAEKAIVELTEELKSYFLTGIEEMPVSLVGSTAAQFEEVFRSVFAKNNITISSVIKDPIPAMVEYHRKDL
jgi:hypothetical protein